MIYIKGMSKDLKNMSSIRCGRNQTVSSINQALDLVDDGGVVFIEPGVYKENLVFSKKVKIAGVEDSIMGMSSAELPIIVLASDNSCKIEVPVEIEGVLFTHDELIAFDKLEDYIGKNGGVEKKEDSLEHKEGNDISLLCVENDAVLKNVGILNSWNRGITISKGTPVVEKSVISHCRNVDLCCDGLSAPKITNTHISNSLKMGVLIKDSATPHFADCCIHDNVRNGIAVRDEANPKVSGCDIYNQLSNGIFVKNKAEGTFEKCDIHGNKLHGIALSGRAAPTINECKIHENGIEDGDCSGITILETASPKISGCDIFNNRGKGVKWYSSHSLDEWAESSQETKEYNEWKHKDSWYEKPTRLFYSSAGGGLCECHIHDNKQNGVAVWGRAEPKIEKCKIHDNKTEGKGYPGVIVGQQASPEMIDCEVYSHLSYGIWLQRNAQGVYKNCDIYNNDDGICIEKSAAGSFKLCHINDNKKRGVLIKNEASPMVENCEIYDHPNGGICLAENAQGIYSKCDIHDNEEQGVCIQDSAKGLFNECDIRDNKGNGLFVDGDSTPKIVKSKIHDNMVEDDSYPGIVVAENASPEFDECDVFNHASYGIWLQNQSQGVYSKCNIYGNEEEGAYIQDAAMGVFSECDVYDNKKQGIFITGKSSPKFEKCVVHDNVGDGKNDSGFCFREDSSPTIIGCEVYNQKIGVILADRANGECMKCNIHNNITGVGAVRSAAGVICESQIHHNNGNGFVIRGESSLKVKKCVVHDNNAEEKVCSGIVIKDDARPEISECEIYNHRGCGICENGIPRQGLNCNIHDNGEENLKN